MADDRGQDEADAVRLRKASEALRDQLELAAQDPVENLTHLVGLEQIVSALRRIRPSVRRSVWVLQPQYFYDPEDPGVALTDSLRDRGVTTQLITRPATLDVHPLLPSLFPEARIGPVFVGAMVVDEERAMVAGEDTVDGQRTSWLTSRPTLVSAVLGIWHATMQVSVPVLPAGVEPPLTRRQLHVAQLLAVGEKDQAIARELGVSARTVERETQAILTELGARSRSEAVLAMRGRGVNGGRPAR